MSNQHPKRHHFVPRFLLNKFSSDEQLWVMPIEQDRNLPYKASVKNVGHVNGGHRMTKADGGEDWTTLEASMAKLEGAASLAITQLHEDKSISLVSRELKEPLAWLAALQRARSRTFLGSVAHVLGEAPNEEELKSTQFELQTSLLRTGPWNLLGKWAVQDNDSVSVVESYEPFVHYLLSLRWDVMRFEQPELVVSDAFAAQYGVSALGKPPSPSEVWGARFGVNVPFSRAEGFTIALSPRMALRVHHRNERLGADPNTVNMHTVRNARSFIAFPGDANPKEVLVPLLDWVLEARGVRSTLPRSL
ncbi:DUF4238 domain-containing protein [Leucobacter sp. 1207-22]|uniref:DUF4238 domain-containing protein n=1 Tax=Leucobacter sp. 1207-22 TaxID=2604456 RepID=UPI004062824C